MKKQPVFAVFLAGLCLLLLTSSAKGPEDWEIIETRDGITLSERWIKMGGHLVRERRGEMTLRGDLNRLLEILSRPSLATQWMENLSESRLVARQSEREWYSYSRFSLPWPLKDRDLVTRSILSSGKGNSWVLDMVSTDGVVPDRKGSGRIEPYRACWVISEPEKGMLRVSFSAATGQKAEFPRMVQDPVVRGAFLRSLSGLRRLVETQTKRP